MMLVFYEIADFNKKRLSHHHLLSPRKEALAIQFLNLVGKDFRKSKEVQYFADVMHISRKYLTRTIKEIFDKTPKQIIEDKVIAEAKLLLLKMELPVSQIQKGNGLVSKEYPATIEGVSDVEIRPQVSGYLQKILVDEGSYVKAGQALFKIDDRLYAEQLNTAKSILYYIKLAKKQYNH